jgi:hypothetical protein
MPVQLTYPGVYVEEVPSGARTITGAATSIAAFVGRARQGPVDDAVDVFSFEQFTRRFGGLWAGSTMSFAVRDFFLNGGSHAVVVRLHNGATARRLVVGGLALEAADPGRWGTDLRAAVDHEDAGDGRFNLTVSVVGAGGASETFRSLSVDDADPRNVRQVLEARSGLVRVAADWAAADPADGLDELGTLEDALGKARTAYRTGTGDKAAVDAAEAALRSQVDAVRAALSDGDPLTAAQFASDAAVVDRTGLYALDGADQVNLLSIPPHTFDGDIEPSLVTAAVAYCEKRRAVFLVDPRTTWTDPSEGLAWLAELDGANANAAAYFPRLRRPNPLKGGVVEDFAPSGAVAGVIARTDSQRGVWKAPAGLDAVLRDVPDLAVRVSDDENGQLNPLGINCLRSMPAAGRVVWGARTLMGADALASDWKYLPVRRLALYIEESLFRGTHWVVFEPNDEPLWSQVRLSVGSFMHGLFRLGAFQGRSPAEAYFVKCDGDTTTQADRDLGVVNINVGFAPLKPAEFVVVRLQQLAGQTQA